MRPRISRSRACRTTSASLTRQLAATLGTVDDRGAEQRALFRRWPTGVSVVVAESGSRRAGLTVNSLVSLSLDPPLVGISLALTASLYEVLREAAEWSVSMLAGDQEHLAQHFARSVPPLVHWDGIAVRALDPGCSRSRAAVRRPLCARRCVVLEPRADRSRARSRSDHGCIRGDRLVRGGRRRQAVPRRLPRGCAATARVVAGMCRRRGFA